ncbi:MAG: MSEP-CTERM sorting domain-containing protein [Candidatus Delongbacteria bacterium]|jgi:hypothetical protein|nr:MSEP-CTERM sorting domain-containing protein [Candidatus Delongbacteria bacterium]
MRNLLNPKWIYLINTFPIVVLFFLFIGEFNIIKTFLDEESINLWKSFGLTLGILGITNLVYAVYLTIRKQKVSVLYGLIALLCYIPFVYLYGYHSEKIIPYSIPQWMISGDMILYVGTFLMPTLAYSLFIIVSHFTSDTKEYKAWKNFLIAILIPVFWYLFFQIILPLWKPVNSNFGIHTLLILIIVGTLVFIFFLIRGIFILTIKKSSIWLKYQLAWKIPISIILPILGLSVSNNLGILRAFNNYWFYVLAVINGVLICFPNIENKLYRLFLFIGRSITFAYTLYFFLVFLPFLPLSMIAIVAIGTGFLMLTPLVLFVIHINVLSNDYTYLKKYFSYKIIWVVSLIGILVIPFSITGTYLRDKSVLNETLNYIYTPDFSKSYHIDKNSLQKTLNVVKQHKDRSSGDIFGTQIPYLSTYFNWLVLDNQTLSNTKINKIEKIFFGKTSFELIPENIRNDNVNITNITTKCSYDENQNAWKSWIDLEITNKSENNWFSEYATIIELPVGCWVSDYYLYVGERKEMGILAEKKSAMWVFSQIRNENRDPGILYYLTGNKVAFRVFPFAKNEVRKTGIEFLHKEPVKLTIDGNIIELGNADDKRNINLETENMVYVSSKQKQTLKQVKREPYFHFLVDVSKAKSLTEITNRIEQAVATNQVLSENAKISFVNSYITTTKLDDNWKLNLQSQNFEGGFYLERAIKKTLFNTFQNNSNYYPVIVVVTDSIQNAVLDKDFSDFKMAFPENEMFFDLKENGKLEARSLISNPIQSLPETISHSFEHSVLEYKNKDNSLYYLSNNNEPSIILKANTFEISGTEIKEKDWETALTMQGMWISQILHPETSNKEWLNLVKYSFSSKVMTPLTSYLVVEDESQKAILKKKQEQVLSGNKSLDLGEDAQRMSEPNMIFVLILFGLTLLYIEKRKRKLKNKKYGF